MISAKKYTRGCEEGLNRCTKCDTECTDTYYCHAGLMDFNHDIIVDGMKAGAIIGGQVLSNEPDEDKFRETASELGIDPDEYIEALRKVPIRTEASIRASAKLLTDIVDMMVNANYKNTADTDKINKLDSDIEHLCQPDSGNQR